MNSIIERSKRDGSLVLYHDYRAGHIQDLSGRGNHGVFGATALNRWINGYGWYLPDTANGSASTFSVADNAALQATTGTLVFFTEACFYPTSAVLQRLISKTDAGGMHFEVYYEPAVLTFAYQGSTKTLAAVTITGSKCLAINFADGATPVGYYNGLLAGNFSGNIAMVANDAPIVVGNYYSLARPLTSILSSFLYFNRQLSATDHSELYGELMSGNT